MSNATELKNKAEELAWNATLEHGVFAAIVFAILYLAEIIKDKKFASK